MRSGEEKSGEGDMIKEMGEMVKDIEKGSKEGRRARQKEDSKRRSGNGLKGCMEQDRESQIK
jgi:hypothetical protein